MTKADEHGFTFVPVDASNPIVQAYHLKFLIDNKLPLHTVSTADEWSAVVRKEDDRVYCVYGWRFANEACIEVTDFYRYPNRYGLLASYAAMEYIKGACDEAGLSVLTMTPTHNTPMIEAYKKYFHVDEPVLYVYRYDPPKTTVSLKMPAAPAEPVEELEVS